MSIKNIEKTTYYEFNKILLENGEKHQDNDNSLRTYFVHRGSLTLNFEGATKTILAGQGFVATPNNYLDISSNEQTIAYLTKSSITHNKPIIEIIDDGKLKIEKELSGVKIIETPKKVMKPWGHELWIVWTKDYHVLKQIGMSSGNQSSLQFHRFKYETNYLEQGEANVINQYFLDPQMSEEEISEKIKTVNFNEYKKTFTPGQSWSSVPGEVHRVIARTDYLAYEVSTPQLDDVIRLQDTAGRKSGRIDSEHRG